jgi:hypothetical protein
MSDILREIEAFLKRTRMPWTQFGRRVAHDPRLVGDMRRGRVPGADLTKRITDFMDDYDE